MCTPEMFLAVAAPNLAIANIPSILDISQANTEAKVRKQQGEFARLQAAKKAARMRRGNAQFLASQKAAFVSGGVALSFGSPLDVLGETAEELELDALSVQVSGENEKRFAEFEAKQIKTAAKIGVATDAIDFATFALLKQAKKKKPVVNESTE